jgi:hypothetical protein
MPTEFCALRQVTASPRLQGFVQFKSRGEITNLGVDELNERLEVKGPLRLRHSMRPDEGYGVIFVWDGVVCDTQSLKRQAWRAVAQARGVLHGNVRPAF